MGLEYVFCQIFKYGLVLQIRKTFLTLSGVNVLEFWHLNMPLTFVDDFAKCRSSFHYCRNADSEALMKMSDIKKVSGRFCIF